METSLPLTKAFNAEYLEYYGIFPMEVADGVLRVAVSGDPGREVLADLEDTFGAPVEQVIADTEQVVDAVRRTFSAAQSVDSLVRSLTDDRKELPRTGDELPGTDARNLANQPPVIRYVNLLIREAHEARASDIHVEATATGPVVRYRIDGVLSDAPAPPVGIQAAVISRLKLIADLDIAERRRPQDGRTRVRLDHWELDVRVSTVPTMFGESIVLRLLDRGSAPTSLESLGMSEALRETFIEIVGRPHGILLATGPTGSGKTTTLYTALQLRDAAREKIITVEDPIEYRLPGITQVPVKRKAGMTFAAGLRAILRQDPDVLMVGELRDSETARVAVQAAMTGHLVLTTVHTNDAASAVSRLVDLGIEPYLVAATLRAVLAQRLVRVACQHCGEWREAGADLHALAPVVEHGRKVRQVAGCSLCRQTGYIGRVGIFELLPIFDEMASRIMQSPDVQTMRRAASEQGMVSLREDGLEKVLAGTTTVREVLRAVEA